MLTSERRRGETSATSVGSWDATSGKREVREVNALNESFEDMMY